MTTSANGFARMLRQTLTIARRDFIATVFTPTFLFFLISPLVMLGFGLIGGMGASNMAEGATESQRIVVLAPADERAVILVTDKRLRDVFGNRDTPPDLVVEAPGGDPETAARAQFGRKDRDASAVLFGSLEKPTILYGARGQSDSHYLAGLAEATLRAQRSGDAKLSTPTFDTVTRRHASASGRGQAAFFTVFGIFFLTLLLAGQAVGTMAEERNNKVIEILAAAVPLEAVFLGKLVGMFGSAVLFVLFWGLLISQAALLLPPHVAAAFGEVGPAIGLPLFPMLFFAYFALAYMLLGAVFLGVGAQATTPRELQMMSLPITIVQVGMFALASRAAEHPGTTIALIAEIFPFSSPFAMAAMAANSAQVWPHVLALAWQIFWVAIVIAVGARAFRRGVLQSGSGRKSRRTSRARELAADAANTISGF